MSAPTRLSSMMSLLPKGPVTPGSPLAATTAQLAGSLGGSGEPDATGASAR
jgi:hypothetical protein